MTYLAWKQDTWHDTKRTSSLLCYACVFNTIAIIIQQPLLSAEVKCQVQVEVHSEYDNLWITTIIVKRKCEA